MLAYISFVSTQACEPNEIHVREQWINSYVKLDGTVVSAHARAEHCREIEINSYFQDKSSKKFANLQTKFKAWKKNEKEALNSILDGLPLWLKKYKLAEILRGSIMKNNPKTPAAAIPFSKTLIIFDSFYKEKNKRDIVIHELSHVAVYDIDPVTLKSFFVASGWSYSEGEDPIPPPKVLLPDSSNSRSEDFANHVEMYYSNPAMLKSFNSKAFEVLEKIIKTKESAL
jgi:hypothetical protein